MKELRLTNSERLVLLDDADFSKVSALAWYLHSEGYAASATYSAGVPGTCYMHRLLTGFSFTDHKDGNKLNNQRANLRACSRSQNGGNRQKQARATSSRFKGVCWDKKRGKWEARLQRRLLGKNQFCRLGRFSDEVTAARAYNAAALARFGEFALLNKV